VGSQAAVVSASRTSLVGSIGGLMAVADFSAMAKRRGVKVHVITSDGAEAFKGAGVPGTKVTDEQLAYWKGILNGLADHFFRDVAAGRGLSLAQVKELADGRVHLAADAKKLRLIDYVESLDGAMRRLRDTPAGAKKKRYPGGSAEGDLSNIEAGGTVPAGELPKAEDAGAQQAPAAGSEADNRKETEMSQPQGGGTTTATAPASPEPKAASMAELKAACPGAPSDFLVEQAEKNATLAQAKDAYLAFQNAQIRARDEELAKLRAEQKPAGQPKSEDKSDAKAEDDKPAKKPGVKPLESKAAEQAAGGADGDGAVAVFEQRVKALTDAGVPRAKAAQKVLAEDDQLRQDYTAARNAAK